MTQLNANLPSYSPAAEDVWPNLRQAIAGSSGFKRWVVERGLDLNQDSSLMDSLTCLYLRQTLETLAY